MELPRVPLKIQLQAQKYYTNWRSKLFFSYDDVNDVRNCNMGGLTDLWQEKEWVQQKIADYLNSLIDIGLVGFRVDAAKHMWPGDLDVIWSKVNSTIYFDLLFILTE